jgi:hypothetical protein
MPQRGHVRGVSARHFDVHTINHLAMSVHVPSRRCRHQHHKRSNPRGHRQWHGRQAQGVPTAVAVRNETAVVCRRGAPVALSNRGNCACSGGNVQRQLHSSSWPNKCVTTHVRVATRSLTTRPQHQSSRPIESLVTTSNVCERSKRHVSIGCTPHRSCATPQTRRGTQEVKMSNVKKKQAESLALLAARGPRTRSRETSRMHTLWSVGKQRLSHSPDQQPTTTQPA